MPGLNAQVPLESNGENLTISLSDFVARRRMKRNVWLPRRREFKAEYIGKKAAEKNSNNIYDVHTCLNLADKDKKECERDSDSSSSISSLSSLSIDDSDFEEMEQEKSSEKDVKHMEQQSEKTLSLPKTEPTTPKT